MRAGAASSMAPPYARGRHQVNLQADAQCGFWWSGAGGREHALAWAISNSPLLTKLFGRPRQSRHGYRSLENVPIGVLDISALVDFACAEKIDMVLPGPEAPLVARPLPTRCPSPAYAVAARPPLPPHSKVARVLPRKSAMHPAFPPPCGSALTDADAALEIHRPPWRPDRGEGRWPCRPGKGVVVVPRTGARSRRGRPRHAAGKRPRRGRCQPGDRGISGRRRGQPVRLM